MAKEGAKPSRNGSNKVTWAQAFRDIVIASMNRGQLPLLAFTGVIALLVWRMPESEISPLIDRVLTRLESGELIGWLAALLLLIGWHTHARFMRKEYAEEFERIGREKSKLQEHAAGRKLQSSQPRGR